MCALFLACVSGLIVDSRDDIEALVILIAALSLSSLFAIERGNIDLLIFALMYIGCVTGRKNLRSPIFAFAAILKIYPIAGMVIDLILRPLREKLWPVLLSVLVIAALALQFHDINLIRRGTACFQFAVLRRDFNQATGSQLRYSIWFPGESPQAVRLLRNIRHLFDWRAFRCSRLVQAQPVRASHPQITKAFGDVRHLWGNLCLLFCPRFELGLSPHLPDSHASFRVLADSSARIQALEHPVCDRSYMFCEFVGSHGALRHNLCASCFFCGISFVLTILAQQIRSFCSAV